MSTSTEITSSTIPATTTKTTTPGMHLIFVHNILITPGMHIIFVYNILITKIDVPYFFLLFIFEAPVPYLLLVTTGGCCGGQLNNTEIIDVGTQESQVPTYPNYPKSLSGATGGWFGNQFIVCGGVLDQQTMTKECYKMEKESVSFHGNMEKKRSYAASIVLDENLWILGGYYWGNREITTEYISAYDGSYEAGPDLPIALHLHSAIKINETTSMLIGGSTKDGYTERTWFYLHLTGQWIDGPELLQARGHHTAGFITDSVTQESFVVVVGGYAYPYVSTGDLDSVEFLKNDETKWMSGNLFVTLNKLLHCI